MEEKDVIICLLYCGGADAADIYVNRKHIGYCEHLADMAEAVELLLKAKQHTKSEVYTVDLDYIDLDAREAFGERDDNELTVSEEQAIMRRDIQELEELWKGVR